MQSSGDAVAATFSAAAVIIMNYVYVSTANSIRCQKPLQEEVKRWVLNVTAGVATSASTSVSNAVDSACTSAIASYGRCRHHRLLFVLASYIRWA